MDSFCLTKFSNMEVTHMMSYSSDDEYCYDVSYTVRVHDTNSTYFARTFKMTSDEPVGSDEMIKCVVSDLISYLLYDVGMMYVGQYTLLFDSGLVYDFNAQDFVFTQTICIETKPGVYEDFYLGPLHPQTGWQCVTDHIEYIRPEVKINKNKDKISVKEHSRPARKTPKNIELVFRSLDKSRTKNISQKRDSKPNRSSGLLFPQAGILDPYNLTSLVDSVNDAADVVSNTAPPVASAIMETCEEATTAFKSFSDTVPKFTETFEKLSNNLTSTSDEIRDFIKGFSTTAQNSCPALGSAKIVSICTGLGISFYGFLNQENSYIAAGVMLCVATGALSIMDPIIAFVRSYFEVKPQMSVEAIKQFSTLVATTMSTYLSFKPKGDIIEHIAIRLEKMGRIDTSLEKSIMAVVSVIEVICDWMARSFFGRSFGILRSVDPLVSEYSEEVEAIRRYHESGSVVDDLLYQRVCHAMKKGQTIAMSFDRASQPGLKSIVDKGLQYLSALRSKIALECNLPSGSKAEPVGIMFRGAPGVGKSLLLPFLCTDILKNVCTQEEKVQLIKDQDAFIYNRCQEQKYWDGYKPCTKICLFDDFGQMRDDASNTDNEFMNFIRAVNSFSYSLHMAHLESKGNMNFLAGFVIGTTNQEKFQSESLLSTSALTRRIDFDIVFSPKPEYSLNPEDPPMARVLNKTKACENAESKDLVFDPSIYTFTITNLDKTVSYEELVELILKRHNYKKEFYTKFVSQMRARASEDLVPQGWRKLEPLIVVPLDNTYTDNEKLLYLRYLELQHFGTYILSPYEVRDLFLKNTGNQESDFSSLTVEELELELRHACPDHFMPSPPPSLYDRFKELWDAMVREVPQIFSILQMLTPIQSFFLTYFAILGVTVISNVVSKLAEWFRNFMWPDLGTQSRTEGKTGKGRRMTKKEMLQESKPMEYVFSGPQMGNIDEVAAALFRSNMYKVTANHGKGLMGYATFVHHNIIMMPYHFLTCCYGQLSESLGRKFDIHSLKFQFSGEINFELSFDTLLEGIIEEANVSVEQTRDVVFIKLPHTIPSRPSILSKLITEAEASTIRRRFSSEPCVLVKGPTNLTTVSTMAHWAGSKFSTDLCFGETIGTTHCYGYRAQTRNGDCGAILLSSSGKIMSIHVLGNESIGYGSEITRELVDTVIATVSPIKEGEPTETIAPQFGKAVLIKTGVNVVIKSQIVPSLLNNFPSAPKTAPAVLRKKNGVDPYLLSVMRYGLNDAVIDMAHLQTVVFKYTDWLLSKIGKDQLGILDFEQACAGVPGKAALSSVSRKTSPGWPWNTKTKLPGKFYWFGSSQDFDFSSPQCAELRDRVELIIDKARDGERLLHCFVDCLKDERLSLEKVAACKTRLISACPLDLLIAYHMYFGSFTQALYEGRILDASAVGINVYSREWDQIVMELRRNCLEGDPDDLAFGAGDYSGFDRNEKPEVHDMLLHVVNCFYDDGNDVIRKVLWKEVYHSVHLRGDLMYQWNASLPSGHPLTTIINNMYNAVMMMCCWADANNRTKESYDNFFEHVTLVTYGDDNIFSVTPAGDFREKFNEITLSKLMRRYGMVYTNDSKEEASVKLRSIDDITFLKRSFSFNPILDRWLAPLNLDTINDIYKWTRKGPNSHTIAMDNVQTSVLEYALHGRKVFERYALPLIKECYRVYPSTTLQYTTYEGCLLHVLNSEEYYL